MLSLLKAIGSILVGEARPHKLCGEAKQMSGTSEPPTTARVAVLRPSTLAACWTSEGPPAQATGTRGPGSWQTSWVLDAAPERVGVFSACSAFPICCLSKAPQILDPCFSP